MDSDKKQDQQRWLEVSGAEGRDYSSARRANEAWLAGVQFKDSTTGLLINVHDIGLGLNVVIRYKNGIKVTNAEMPAVINPSISETEAQAIIRNLSHEQAAEWETVAKPDEIEIDVPDEKPEEGTGGGSTTARFFHALEWPDSPRPPR
jgi:hypothetical protein